MHAANCFVCKILECAKACIYAPQLVSQMCASQRELKSLGFHVAFRQVAQATPARCVLQQKAACFFFGLTSC